MAQTHEGAMKALARKRGLTIQELEDKLKTHSYCNRCESWKTLAAIASAFGTQTRTVRKIINRKGIFDVNE